MTYKAAVQEVLLYGGKILLVTDAMMMVLEGFNHIIARRISGMTARKGNSGECEWALVDEALEVIGILYIR